VSKHTGTRHAPHDHAAAARRLEAEIADYPDEAGEILLEAAQEWRQARKPQRAAELLRGLIEAGGRAGEYARIELAEMAFDTDDSQTGYAELAALRAARPRDADPCQMAAELLEERGDLDGALQWYNLAVGRLSEADLDTIGTFAGLSTGMILAGRKAIRAKLGFTPDELDERAPEPGPDGLLGRLFDELLPVPRREHQGFPTTEELPDEDGELVAARAARTLFWQRDALVGAQRRWPQLVDPAETPAGYYRRLESQYKQLSERGIASIVLVPATPQDLASHAETVGGAVTDELVRRGYMDAAYARGQRIAWPPPRNEPCWCGSGAKYKRCCGNPANR
jgi:tetratricopeptide (TPR) repeat protein